MKKLLLTFNNGAFLIIIYSIVLLLIAFFHFRKNNEKKPIFSCKNLFIMFYYVFIAIGPILLVTIKDYKYNYNVFLIILSALLCFLIGTKIKIPELNLKKYKIKFFDISQIKYENVLKNSYILLTIGYCFAILYLGKSIPYIMQDFENNRVLAMQGNGVIIHFSYIILPATWLLYYCHLNYKKNNLVYLFFAIDILLLLFIGFRSRIMELLLIAIIIHNDHKPFKIKKLVLCGVFLIIAVTFLQIVRTYMSTGVFSLSFDSILITLGVNSINLKSIFAYFPNKIPFQFGYTYLLSLSVLLPSSSSDATMWLKEVLNMNFDGGGVTPSILGEFYINFGFIGIFIGMFILGIFISKMDNYAISHKTNKLIYFILSLYIARSVSSGLSNFVIISAWFILVTFVALKFSFKKE